MGGGWREAVIGDESSSRWAAGEEKQLDGGAAYDWAGDSLAVPSTAEAACRAHQGHQDPKDEAILFAKDKKARRYVRALPIIGEVINWSRAMLTTERSHDVSPSNRLNGSYHV